MKKTSTESCLKLAHYRMDSYIQIAICFLFRASFFGVPNSPTKFMHTCVSQLKDPFLVF